MLVPRGQIFFRKKTVYRPSWRKKGPAVKCEKNTHQKLPKFFHTQLWSSSSKAAKRTSQNAIFNNRKLSRVFLLFGERSKKRQIVRSKTPTGLGLVSVDASWNSRTELQRILSWEFGCKTCWKDYNPLSQTFCKFTFMTKCAICMQHVANSLSFASLVTWKREGKLQFASSEIWMSLLKMYIIARLWVELQMSEIVLSSTELSLSSFFYYFFTH